MYYTGLDPQTMQPVYVARTYEEKAMQRALMQFTYPQNYQLVYKALKTAGRLDLVGNTPKCLIPYRSDLIHGRQASCQTPRPQDEEASEAGNVIRVSSKFFKCGICQRCNLFKVYL